MNVRIWLINCNGIDHGNCIPELFGKSLAPAGKEIENELAAYQKKTFENKKHRNVINSYQRQLDSVQKVYNAAIQKFDELLMTSNVAIANASVMRWAELPEKASKPLLKNNLIFGAIAGLMFSLSLSFC
jgi:uncharacterized protein involved in exopolysaccharide biosynthesis